MMTASYSPGSVPHVLAKSEPVSTNLQRSIRSNSALNDAVRSRLMEKLPMPRLHGERRGELRAVVIRLVALDGASQTVVEVLIGFLVVERTQV